MKLLSRMMAIQHVRGALTDEALRELAREEGVPLHRLEGLRGFYPVFRSEPAAGRRVQVCRDVVCRMRGGDICGRIREALAADPDVEVEEVSCIGRCDHAPAAAVDDVPISGGESVIVETARGERPMPAAEPAPPARHWPTDPYPRRDHRFGVLRRVLSSGAGDAERDRVVAALTQSGLRGLGGAAFPTGRKWDFTRRAAGDEKYVICNADESEPGTFKDRVILAELPHLIIEAMVIGGWVIGAAQGVIYLRHEYEPERRILQQAIDDAYQRGVLGESVCGSGFRFDLRIFVSPGGYILGEETALLEALEDRRGEPRNKPPFPTNVGLNGKPTLMNNVETFAAVPVILERGAEWWTAQGKDGFAGLKYVCVSGDVARPGVYCVPWGATVAEVLETCGGMADGRALMAFSPGGASTNFLPAGAADTPLDFDALAKAGSAMGTAALVFVGEGRDMLDVAMSQTRFFRNESCGKCVPCRIGTHKAVQLVEQALDGRARNADTVSLLDELDSTLAKTSICGLGQVALAPLVNVIRQFPESDGVKALRGSGGGA